MNLLLRALRASVSSVRDPVSVRSESRHSSLVPHHCIYPLSVLCVSAFSALSPEFVRSGSRPSSLVTHHSHLPISFPHLHLQTPARSRAINVLPFQRVTNSGGRGVVCRLDVMRLEVGGRKHQVRSLGAPRMAPKPDTKRCFRPHFLTNSRGFPTRLLAAQPQGTLHLRSRSADWIPQSDSVKCRGLRQRQKCCALAFNFQRARLRGGSLP